MNYEKPEIIVKSLATDEMIMANYCGMSALQVLAASSQTCLQAAYDVPGGGQDNNVVRFTVS